MSRGRRVGGALTLGLVILCVTVVLALPLIALVALGLLGR